MSDAVIFDIDGTLLDSVDYHAQAWVEAFQRFGIDVPFADVRFQIGKGGDQLIPVFVSENRRRDIEEELTEERARHFKTKYLPLVRPFPKVRELFVRLRSDGKRVLLASSGKRAEVEEYKAIADIADLVDAETSADDADRSKPHPDIFQVAIGKLDGIAKDRIIAVGDTPYDAEAAGKAGLKTVGVLCGGFPADVLKNAGCIRLYRDPAELLEQYATSPLA